jgi:putative protease
MALLPYQLELLSPAKNADIGIEAINHGADAVYIGGPGFGARASAGNSLKDIERLCRHAHRFNSQIFITLNTILRDDELEGARQLAWDVYRAGADVLIVQDMALLEMDLPPIQLHASTQTDIRTVEKARFLQDVGFSQIVLARELTLEQIAEIRAATDPNRCSIEFFIHGALCVAYSGQCFISHAHTGRSANRGDCSQACRLPYNVMDDQGRFVAHQQHVLSMKDNDQSANMEALINAGVQSFKIEGRYKDMAYVKNITAHYRQLLDGIMESRESGADPARPPLSRLSSGRTTFLFTPDPNRNFNRGTTDYFVNGRKEDIGAFDTPKHAGLPIGYVSKIGEASFEIETTETLYNGDAVSWFDLQKELHGCKVNVAKLVAQGKGGSASTWRIEPNEAMETLEGLRKGVEINRNRDMSWDRLLAKKSSDRRIGVWLALKDTPTGFTLQVTDEEGHMGQAQLSAEHQLSKDPLTHATTLQEKLGRLGDTVFEALDVSVTFAQPWFIPSSSLNELRRQAVQALEASRAKAYQRPSRLSAIEPPVPYPEDSLTYLANVYNEPARAFYAKHGVKVIEAAYESHEELGEASLMITKHCVRFSLSLCPKQAKGVIGVKGTVKAEPLVLVNGKEKLTLRFDCKPCEMHVVGKIKTQVLNQRKVEMQEAMLAETPLKFYRQRPSV